MRQHTLFTALLLTLCILLSAALPGVVPAAAADGEDPSSIILEGTLDEINAYYTENRLSDGLPIIPPTPEKVSGFFRYTDRPWNESLGTFGPGEREALVYHVAVNGVMAGCKPEWMPLMVAFAEAMRDESWVAAMGGEDSWNAYAVVHGPLARQLGFDCGQGEISEENNAAFGRFMNLALMNLSGFYRGENRNSPFGYVLPWTLAENEEACAKVDWNPYHVQQGFDWNDSALTAGSSLTWGSNLAPSTTEPEKIKDLIAYDITEKSERALGSGSMKGERLVLVTEAVAADLAALYTKESLEAALVKTARRPAQLVGYSRYYANPEGNVTGKMSREQCLEAVIAEEDGALTDAPPWYKSIVGGQIYTVPALEEGQAAILVTGDSDRNKVQVMPGGPRVTVGVTLPADWDELMAELEYEPLESFYLS